jgi:hypothetical protein
MIPAPLSTSSFKVLAHGQTFRSGTIGGMPSYCCTSAAAFGDFVNNFSLNFILRPA